MPPRPLNEQTSIDMAEARNKSTVDVDAITRLLHGGKEGWENHQRLVSIVSREPLVNELKTKRHFMSRTEHFTAAQAVISRLNELRIQHGWSDDQLERALHFTNEYLPSTLHAIAFLPVLLRQGTDEQIARWAAPASHRALLGCYAQTELGHGTDVAELETTATFDRAQDEFVVNSPTRTNSKWWIGSAGRMATHAVVQAQLVLEGGKRMGPHLFVVQLRDLETLEPLPGRRIGDIGPKAYAAHAATDHGFIRFDNVRIPRDHMLSRFTSVSREGKYQAGPHAKLSYGGMLYIRAHLNLNAAVTLSKATTIAIRYCTVRRQGKVGDDGLAPAVISYPSTYYRLLPLLARSYVWNIVARDIISVFERMSLDLAKGNATELPIVHAALAGLKSLITADVLHGIDTARRSLGGHGFSAFAGVGRIWADWAPAVTFEGDNYVLDKQVVRAMLKASQIPAEMLQRLGPDSYFACLAGSKQSSSGHINIASATSAELALLLQLRAARLVRSLASAADAVGDDAAIESDPGIEARLSKAVTEAFAARIIARTCSSAELPGGEVVRELLTMYLLITLESGLAELLEHNVLPPSAAHTLRERIGQSCKRLLPEAIGLSDAFGWTDWELDSALGVKKADVYDQLWERATTSGFNASQDVEYKSSIKAMLKRGQEQFQQKAKL